MKNKKSKNTNPEDEISKLKKQIAELTPESGTGLSTTTKKFIDLPLSKSTLLGLAHDNKTTLTDIQSAAILHALAGRDILACARTGSGKTLAFILPLLERLYREHITSTSNILGAIILSPTRELATQIFTVLRIIGKHHSISAGILIGGKKEFYKEQSFLSKTNIIVATPGRLLQHLEQSVDMDVGTIEVLVLDEADRILDMGFRSQLERILEYVPKGNRQTMLFSATQTRKLKDLAKLSLNNPEYIFIHSKDKDTAIVSSLPPSTLDQLYMLTPLEHKLDLLFSFLKSRQHHTSNSIIVFFSTCSQVQHAHALFCALRPGISILALHGKLKQEKRSFIYDEFLKKSNEGSVVLFSTDIASRGLDFPNVSWVLSLDAPDGKEDYIHRVGRTARYQSKGKSLVFLLPSEEQPFLNHLSSGKASISLKKMNMNPKKAFRISTASIAGSILAKHSESTLYAKKAFQSYLRCYSLMPLKDIFDISQLPLEAYALSLGLPSVPSLSFLDKIKGMTRDSRREVKNENKKLKQLKEEIQMERLAKKKRKIENETTIEEEDDDFLSIKQNQTNALDTSKIELKPTTNKKIKFDEDGNEQEQPISLSTTTAYNTNNLSNDHDNYLKIVQDRLKQSKEIDVKEEKERIRQKKLKYKLKKAENCDGGDDVGGVQLAVYDYEDAGSQSGDDSNDDDDSSNESNDDDDSSDSDTSSNDSDDNE